ncbi:Eco29kI family restriction endonuclease [Brevundimonas aurifodinae]|uniref:Eco29kI family restriction endonuclease n=2 Tax=Brevundimonas TaxID=41275 RepID=A0ABV1NJ21_9CAUL
MTEPYNPLDKLNLARSIEVELLGRPMAGFGELGDLSGAGVYAIYYFGPFAAYAPITDGGRPIYVGKAIPKGGRKGGLGANAGVERALRDRLGQHASSIQQATNLESGDFKVRALVVDDIWIPLGENMLIESFQPVWNVVIDGFGNKTPGARRATQFRSPWDVLHPGRTFAEMLAAHPLGVEVFEQRVRDYLAGKAVPLAPEGEGDD